MSPKFRLVLILGCLYTLLFFLRKISKNKVRISHAVYWILLSGALMVLSVFPELADWAAGLLGIYSTQNFIFLVAICLLVYQLFITTLRVSKLNEQVSALTQELAIQRRLKEEEETSSPAEVR